MEVFELKMLTTQIAGLLQRIAGNQEEAIEDTARLLAQAAAGEGRVLLAGFSEMDGVTANALEGAEPFAHVARLTEETTMGPMDRVWLLVRNAADDEALTLARSLADDRIPFAAVANAKASEENELSELADAYIATGLSKGLLPDDDGNRIVEPHLLATLFIYEAVKMSYDEMLADLDE